MKNQIATTIEQSQRLIACGVNPDSADMVWTTWNNDGERLTQLSTMSEFAYEVSCLNPIPAWSLSTLLTLMPNRILMDDAWYECQICLCPFGYEVRYHSEVFKDPFGCLCKNPIEGCVNAIEWLTQNGYKLNKP